MKLIRRVFLRTVPVIIVAVVTLVMSNYVYQRLIDQEKESAWTLLDVAANNLSEKVSTRLLDNMNMLDRVADALIMKGEMDALNSVFGYLDSVQKTTIFSRIDIVLPDGRKYLQSGELEEDRGVLSYDELLARGAHLSERYTDMYTGKEVVYYLTPIVTDGITEGLLIGTIDCDSLPDAFPVRIFGGEAILYLVERSSGNFIMNRDSGGRGDIGAFFGQKRQAGNEIVNFRDELLGGNEGRGAFQASGSGNLFYMAYRPVEGVNWSLMIVLEEQAIFTDVRQLQRLLMYVGAVEVLLLAGYVIWNLIMTVSVVRHEEELRRVEVERVTNEAKSSFLSSVSHDIRTPLNGIIGMLEIIERHRDDPAQMDSCLKKIRVSTQYLMTLADDVLDLTELESGKLVLRSEPFDLRELAEELDVLVVAKAKEMGVAYHMDYGALRHPHVVGSAVHLRRILVNLITNAIKYNKKNGEVFVTIEETSADYGHGEYRFTVRDTGIGMTRAFQETMFHSFAQEHAGARSEHRGHGLGLTIVQRLLEKMGGSIDVQSEKGKGSTFTVTLPFEIDLEPRYASAAKTGDAPMRLDGVRVLLVEDNELNMEIAQVLLGDLGAKITPAVNGRQAVEIFSAAAHGAFDVILMDIMMPEMDGLEATRAIRRLKRPDAGIVPVIAMTANTFAEDVQRCREAGMDEHVGKPLNMQELIGKIAKHSDTVRVYR